MRLLDGVLTVEALDEFLATVDDIAAETATTVQAFDADYVVSEAHLQRAVERADRAIARGENVARERAVEILCYAAGRRQINRALEMGVSEGKNRVVVLVDSPDGDAAAERAAVASLRESLDIGDANRTGASDKGDPDRTGASDEGDANRTGGPSAGDILGEYDETAVRAFFDVSDAEMAAATGSLPDVVLERVALLDVEK